MCLTHYKRGCLPPPLSPAFLLSLCPLVLLTCPLCIPPTHISLFMCSWLPLLIYSVSAFLCLYYPLHSPQHTLNKLYAILYLRGKGCLGMGPLRHSLPPYLITHPLNISPISLSFYKHINPNVIPNIKWQI